MIWRMALELQLPAQGNKKFDGSSLHVPSA